jgi:L-2-hydroxyglutarate oxidase LhgO
MSVPHIDSRMIDEKLCFFGPFAGFSRFLKNGSYDLPLSIKPDIYPMIVAGIKNIH